MKLRLKHLAKAIRAYKDAIRRDIVNIGDKSAAMLDNTGANKAIDNFFR